MKVSALIFSMNRVENVVSLVEKIKPYVDEVVIVDSSKKEKHEFLKEKLKDARIYWFPPLGVVELYYKIGLDLCNNEWVIHLEDDEDPSEELLRDLRDLVQVYGGKYKVFKVLRGSKKKQMIFRIFNKEFIVPTGVIHWTWAAKTNDILDLDKKYFILHPDLNLKNLIKTFKRYAIIESYQYGYKILAALYKDYIKYQNPSSFARKAFRILFEVLSKLNKKFAFFVSTALYNFYFFFFGIKNREFLRPLIYFSLIQIQLLRNFGRKYEIWLKMWEAGDPIKYAGMDEIEKFNRIAEKLDPEDGMKNFVALMERKYDGHNWSPD
jgi:hypothetical protein